MSSAIVGVVDIEWSSRFMSRSVPVLGIEGEVTNPIPGPISID